MMEVQNVQAVQPLRSVQIVQPAYEAWRQEAEQSLIKIRNPKLEIRNKPKPNKSQIGKFKTRSRSLTGSLFRSVTYYLAFGAGEI